MRILEKIRELFIPETLHIFNINGMTYSLVLKGKESIFGISDIEMYERLEKEYQDLKIEPELKKLWKTKN